jgi:hypothetical protein
MFRSALLAFFAVAIGGHAQVGGSSSCIPGITPGVPIFPLTDTVDAVADYTLFCTNTGFTSTVPVVNVNFNFFTNVTQLNTGAWTLTEGVNTYSGAFVFSNGIQFTSVAYDRNQPTLSFELHGVEVNPSLWGHDFVYHETVSISGAIPISFSSNPDQVVAVNANSPEPGTLLLAAGALLLLRRRAV